MVNQLSRVWNNGSITVILRRKGKGEKHRIRVQGRAYNHYDDRYWLSWPGKRDPVWNADHNCWEVPKSRFDDFVKAALRDFKKLYIIQPFVETEICSPSCRNATGFICQCSCMGQNHGSQHHDGWFDVAEAFSIKTGEKYLAARLLIGVE